jgi:hypothetical protein
MMLNSVTENSTRFSLDLDMQFSQNAKNIEINKLTMESVFTKQTVTRAQFGVSTSWDPVEYQQRVRPWDILCIPHSRG